jgi:hypothetical protein
VGILVLRSGADAHQAGTAFIDILGGGDELGADVEQALGLDHFGQHLRGTHVRLFEHAGLQPGFGVGGQHAPAFHAEQPVEALFDPAAAPGDQLDRLDALRRRAGGGGIGDQHRPVLADRHLAARRHADRPAFAQHRAPFAVDQQARGGEREVAAPGIGFLALVALHREQALPRQRDVERSPGLVDRAFAHIRAVHRRIGHRPRFQARADQRHRGELHGFGAKAGGLGIGHVARDHAFARHGGRHARHRGPDQAVHGRQLRRLMIVCESWVAVSIALALAWK